MLSTRAKDVQAVHIGLAQLEYDGAPLAAAARRPFDTFAMEQVNQHLAREIGFPTQTCAVAKERITS